MATTPVPAFIAPPDFPTLSDRASGTYNSKAFAWAEAMQDTTGPNIHALAVTAKANADEAAAQAELATTNGEAQVALAAAQAELADADRVQTGLDRVATAADRVQTGLDRVQTGADRTAAAASAVQASKLNLGNKASAPTLDNQGAALLAGATYYDTTLNKWRVWTGVAWGDGISAIAGVASVNGMTGNVSLASASLSGNTTIYVGQVIAYTITDFDSFSTYAVSASAGSVTRTLDAISFTAPAVAGNVTLTVTTNGVARAVALTVLPATVAAPTITSPTNAATGVTGPSLTLTSSAFAWTGVSDTHLNSDWQLATDAGFTAIVQSTSADAANKTSWSTTVAAGTTYYVRVRHRGTVNGASSYSATVTFSTAVTFNSYITTPTATPAAFGDPFEGGFYTGQIWNELVQSASSYAVGTGSKAFTVADMTTTPLVYAGQTLEVRSRANPANKMIGVVTGALGTALTINVTSVGGAGTFTDWSIMAQYRVIVAPKSTGENTSIAYKNATTAAPVACGTLSEGRKATLAMVAADTSTVYPAAHWCNNLSIAGKTDWYLPARDELELCWRNLKPTADANYVSLDRSTGATPNYQNLGSYGDTANTHGLSPNTSPAGAAHTSGVPAQVAAGKSFRASESEAFAYGSFGYWSASEYSATNAWSQAWDSSYPGCQANSVKPNAAYVRAVRRSII